MLTYANYLKKILGLPYQARSRFQMHSSDIGKTSILPGFYTDFRRSSTSVPQSSSIYSALARFVCGRVQITMQCWFRWTAPAAGLVLVFCGFGTQHPKAAKLLRSREVNGGHEFLQFATDPSDPFMLEPPEPDRTQREKSTRHGQDLSVIWVISNFKKNEGKRGRGFCQEKWLFECFWSLHRRKLLPEELIILPRGLLVPSDYAEDIPKEWWSQAPCLCCLQERLDVV